MKLSLVFAIASGCGVLGVASCATNDDAPAPPEDAGSHIVPFDASEAGDAADAGDAASPCTEDWCPVSIEGLANVSLNAVWGSAPNDVWVVGTRGFAAHFDGTAWQVKGPSTLLALFSVWGSGPNDVWAGNSGKAMYHWQGTSWEAAALPGNDGRVVVALSGTTADNVLAVVEPNGDFFTSCDDSSGFAFGNCPTVYRLSKVNGALAWRAATDDAFACKTMFVSSNQCAGLGGLWVGSSGEPWLVGQGGKALRPSGSAVPPALAEVVDETHTIGTLEGTSGSSDQDVWAVGAQGAIRHFTGGAEWSLVTSPTTAHLRAVWAASKADAWAAGDDGTIVHWDGKAWTISASPDTRTLYGVWGTPGGDVWAVGEHTLLRHTPGGAKR